MNESTSGISCGPQLHSEPLAKLPVWEPPRAIRGAGGLRSLEFTGHALDRLIHRFLPPALNPFAQLGAVANT